MCGTPLDWLWDKSTASNTREAKVLTPVRLSVHAGGWRTGGPSFIRHSHQLLTRETAHTARAPESSRVLQKGVFAVVVPENRCFQGFSLGLAEQLKPGLYMDHFKQKVSKTVARACACLQEHQSNELTRAQYGLSPVHGSC